MKKTRKLLAMILALAMVMCMLPATVVAISEQSHRDLARETAGEGMVLLKNRNDILPLDSSDTVALFGSGSVNYGFGGGGSGDVQINYTPDSPTKLLLDAAEAGRVNVYKPLAEAYQANSGYVPDDAMYEAAAAAAETAIMFIRRYAAEGSDQSVSEWYLTSTEKEMLVKLSNTFENVIVLLNHPSVMSTDWSLDGNAYGIDVDALIAAYMGGETAPLALVDILLGDINPSGKLVDTWAKDIYDYASTSTFLENTAYVRYTDDIYVGYRYFETFAKDKVAYEFGFGLSYTDFEIKTNSVTNDGESINVNVTVTNTGDMAGKEVVQVYYSAPQMGENNGAVKLSKSAIDLAAYKKTELLAPGASQTMDISYAIDSMASFDDYGYTGNQSAYVLEAGIYDIIVGNSVRNNEKVGEYVVNATTVTEQLSQLCETNLDTRLLADGSYEALEEYTDAGTDMPVVSGDTVTVIESENYNNTFDGALPGVETFATGNGYIYTGTKWVGIPSGKNLNNLHLNYQKGIGYTIKVTEAGTYNMGFVTALGTNVNFEDAVTFYTLIDGEKTFSDIHFDATGTSDAGTSQPWWNFMYTTEDYQGNAYQIYLPEGTYDLVLYVEAEDMGVNFDKFYIYPETVSFTLNDVLADYGVTVEEEQPTDIPEDAVVISKDEVAVIQGENYSNLYDGAAPVKESFASGNGFLYTGTEWMNIGAGTTLSYLHLCQNKPISYNIYVKDAGTYHIGYVAAFGADVDMEDISTFYTLIDGEKTESNIHFDVTGTANVGTAQPWWNFMYTTEDNAGNAYEIYLPAGSYELVFNVDAENCGANYDKFYIIPEGMDYTVDDVIADYRAANSSEDWLDEDNYVGIKYNDVLSGEATIEEFLAQMSLNEMIDFCSGHTPGLNSYYGTIGSSSDNTSIKYGIYSADTSDGPQGISIVLTNMDVHWQTWWPCLTLQACTWNEELLEEVGEIIGQEAYAINVDIWLAPGLNIHRNPLCGRNFEYYSEDPLVTGKCAAAVTKGCESVGVAVQLKHFATNNKETNRHYSDSRVSERALREIYLKGFEIAIKESDPESIMASYNILNGVRVAENSELLKGILREEWGWDGLISSDYSDVSSIVAAVNAGLNVKMSSGNLSELREGVKNGLVSRETLEENTKYVLSCLANCPDAAVHANIINNVAITGTTRIDVMDYARKSYHSRFEYVPYLNTLATTYAQNTDVDGHALFLEFKVNVQAAGTYEFGVNYTHGYGNISNAFEIYVNGEKANTVDTTAYATGGWANYADMKQGTIDLPAGESVIKLQHVSGLGVNYRQIFLTPAFDTVAVGSGTGAYGDTVNIPVTVGFDGLSTVRGTVSSELTLDSISSNYEFEFNAETNTIIVWKDGGTDFKKGETLFTANYVIDRYAADGLANGTYPVELDIAGVTYGDTDLEAWTVANGSITVETEYAQGDVNFDGKLTNADVITIARYLVDLIELSDEQLEIADLSGDGVVSNTDLVRLVRAIVEEN